MNSILIIGGSGLVGSTLIERLTVNNNSIAATYFSNRITHKKCNTLQLDITDRHEVDRVIERIQPDIVISGTAKRNTRYCEENPDEAYKVNVEGTRNIVNACKAMNAKMVFFSSDQVFDGSKGRYREEDEVNPLNVYGKQKVMAEKIITDTLDNWLILRASHIYAWSPGSDNFVSWVLGELQKGQEIQIVYDQYITPIHVENVVDILLKLLKKDKKSIYHVGEGECLSKYAFVKRIKETFRFDKAIIKAVSSEALNQGTVRPRNNCLDLSKIKNELDFSKYSIESGLEIMKHEEIQHG